MISDGTWRYVNLLLGRSLWMRFTLEYTRGRWCAVFFHERGRIYGKQWGTTPEAAARAAAEEASKKSLHLGKRNEKARVTT